MFELSLAELLVIAVAGIIVIGPRDLPKAIRAVLGAWKQFQKMVAEIRRGINELADESGVKELQHDLQHDMEYIVDQQGNLQPTYDISDLLPRPAITDQSTAQHEVIDEPAKPA